MTTFGTSLDNPNDHAIITTGSIFRNSAWNIAGQLLPFAGALVGIPLLLAQLGVERLGFVLLAWIVAGTASFLDLGLGRATTRLIASVPADDTERTAVALWASLVLMFGVGAIFGVLLLVAAPAIFAGGFLSLSQNVEQEAVAALRVLAVAIPFVTASAGLRGALEARQRFDLVNFVRAPAGILTYVGPVAATTLIARSLPVAMVGLVAARLLTFGAYAFVSWGVVPWWRSKAVDLPTVASVARFGAWLSVSGVAGPAVAQMDKFVLGSMLSAAAVSYYATPYEVATKVWVLPGALSAVLFAAFATLDSRGDRRQSNEVFNNGFTYLLMALIAVSAAVVAIGPWALGVWLGRDFASHSGLVLQIMSIGVFANSLAYVPTVFIQGSGRPDLTAKLYFIELIPYLILLWAGIHIAGVEGAAIAWTLRCTVDALALFVMSGIRLNWRAREFRRIGGLSVASFGVLLAAILLRPSLSSAVYLPLIGVAVGALLGATFITRRLDLHGRLSEEACPVCGSSGQTFMRDLRDSRTGISGAWSLVRCTSKSCGAAWLWPMPPPQVRPEFYSDYYTHRNGSVNEANRPAILQRLEQAELVRLGYRTDAEAVRAWMWMLTALYPGGSEELGASVMYLRAPRTDGGTVLDVGCGNGSLMHRLVELGWVAIGVDPDAAAIAQARLTGLDARLGTVADQEFPDNFFDAVVSSHVIEHTDLPVELLQECERILKPGGILVFVTPNLNSICRRAFGASWSSLDPPRHLVLHTATSLKAAGRLAKLDIVSCASTVRYARSIVNLSGRLWLRGRLDNETVGGMGQLLAVPVQLLERVLIALRLDCGEELRLVAVKRNQAAPMIVPGDARQDSATRVSRV